MGWSGADPPLGLRASPEWFHVSFERRGLLPVLEALPLSEIAAAGLAVVERGGARPSMCRPFKRDDANGQTTT